MEKNKPKTEEKEIEVIDAFIEALVNISLTSKVMAKKLMHYQINLMKEESKCSQAE